MGKSKIKKIGKSLFFVALFVVSSCGSKNENAKFIAENEHMQKKVDSLILKVKSLEKTLTLNDTLKSMITKTHKAAYLFMPLDSLQVDSINIDLKNKGELLGKGTFEFFGKLKLFPTKASRLHTVGTLNKYYQRYMITKMEFTEAKSN